MVSVRRGVVRSVVALGLVLAGAAAQTGAAQAGVGAARAGAGAARAGVTGEYPRRIWPTTGG